MMDKVEYEMKLRQAFTIARLLLEIQSLPELLEAQQRSEAFGCFVDPTLWMKGIDALGAHMEITAALLEAQGKIAKARQKLGVFFERELAAAAAEAERLP